MVLILWLMMTSIVGILLIHLVRSDHARARQFGLALNGIPVEGWRVVAAERWVNRRAGLLNHAALAPHTGLWLIGARAVHTKGMLFAIDVVALNADGEVLVISESIPPNGGRLSFPQGTVSILEIAAGAARGELALKVGDVLTLKTTV